MAADTSAPRAVPYIRRSQPWILTYHSVTDPTDDPYGITVSAGRLDEQLTWLRRRGLTGVGVTALLRAHAAGRRGLVGLTFDDGYADFLHEALPVLLRHGCSATVFVLPGRAGGSNAWDPLGPRKPLLTEEGIRALAGAGMEIGSHGMHHRDLTALADDELREETHGSREAIRRLTGTGPAGFCYPYGTADRRVVASVRDAGYAYGCALTPGPLLGPLALPRTHVSHADRGARLRAKAVRHRLRHRTTAAPVGRAGGRGTVKVLHIITGLGIGGAEQQLRLLLRHLPVRCDVVTLTNPGAVAEGLRADGVRVRNLAMNGNRDLTAVPRLTRLIRRGAYDLVHTHLYRACVYGRIAARLAGTTSVATEHSLGRAEIEGRPLTRGTRALYLRTERLGAATVAVSGTVAGRLRDWGVPAARIHTVPNGIDVAAFRFDHAQRRATRALLGIPDDAFVVGGVGRLVPGKRFDLLIRAVAALPGAWLVLAGEGPEAGALRALATRSGVADRVRFLGGCGAGGDTPGIPPVLWAMDTFVSASREETFGLAVVEALAAGLPVVHGVCPAVDDLPPGLAPDTVRLGSLTDPVGELTTALRHRMASGTRRLPPPPAVDRYDIRLSGERLMNVYAHALDPAPSTERAHS